MSPVQLAGPAAFVIGSGILVLLVGIPDQRDVVGLWLLAGLLAFSLGDLRGWASGVIRDWLPFFALLIAYDALRGGAKGMFAAHYMPQIRFDEALCGGTDPTVRLQHLLWNGQPHWYDIVLAGVYLTHFFATPALAAVLWKRQAPRFRQFVTTVAILSATGLLTYALYPAAPPWLAGERGLLPHVTRIVPTMWRSLGLHFAGSLVESGDRFANNVAAVPSLHTAFATIVAAFLWPRRWKWLRPLVAAYPLAMAFALLYTGEHYLFDIVLGWVYAAVALAAAAGVSSRRSAARQPAADLT